MRKSAPTQRKKLKSLRLAEVTASTGIGPPRQEYVLAVFNPQHGEPPVTVSHAILERAIGFVGGWTTVRLPSFTIVHAPLLRET